MGRDLGLDGVVEHFTLVGEELTWLRNKSGASRLGFCAMLKFLLGKGRFPRGRFELPDDAIEHLGRQVKVPAAEIAFYGFSGRTARAHRKEIRQATGFRPCTVADGKALAAWLSVRTGQEERRTEQVRAQLLAHCRTARIEPPTAERIARIVDSGIRQADDRLISTVAGRLEAGPIAALEALVALADEESEPSPAADTVAGAAGKGPEPDLDVLCEIKASPGNASLATMLSEITKLEAVRAIGLPPGLFTGIHPKVVCAWRARAAVESPSHLRDHPQPVRLVLQAALVYINTLMIQDALAEPEWADALTNEDRRALNPLFTMHMTPYGEVKLNMSSRLNLSDSTAAEPAEVSAADQ